MRTLLGHPGFIYYLVESGFLLIMVFTVGWRRLVCCWLEVVGLLLAGGGWFAVGWRRLVCCWLEVVGFYTL